MDIWWKVRSQDDLESLKSIIKPPIPCLYKLTLNVYDAASGRLDKVLLYLQELPIQCVQIVIKDPENIATILQHKNTALKIKHLKKAGVKVEIHHPKKYSEDELNQHIELAIAANKILTVDIFKKNNKVIQAFEEAAKEVCNQKAYTEQQQQHHQQHHHQQQQQQKECLISLEHNQTNPVGDFFNQSLDQ